MTKILEVLGNNTYLADSGSGPKHVSGDLISSVSEKAERVIGGGDILIQDIGNDLNDFIVDDKELFDNDDNVSISSESSMGSDVLYFNDNVAPHNNINVRVRKKRRTQVEQLGQPDAALQRLRPRNR